ncbi:MAG: transposase [Planctomycetaceae bacterium]|nr:transposase [Planctomycetaceae bacterium]
MLITLLKWPPRRGRNTTGSRTAPKAFLNDSQWLLIADLFPKPKPSPAGGRPPHEPRPCLEGILWILASGARWQDLPERYPSPSTCWRRLRAWTDSGVFLEAWKRVLGKLDRLKGLHWEEAIGDGSFSRAPFSSQHRGGAPRSLAAAKARP